MSSSHITNECRVSGVECSAGAREEKNKKKKLLLLFIAPGSHVQWFRFVSFRFLLGCLFVTGLDG